MSPSVFLTACSTRSLFVSSVLGAVSSGPRGARPLFAIRTKGEAIGLREEEGRHNALPEVVHVLGADFHNEPHPKVCEDGECSREL